LPCRSQLCCSQSRTARLWLVGRSYGSMRLAMGGLMSAPDEARSVAEKPEDPREGQDAPKHKTECLLGHRQPSLLSLL
jgi:hypothetical protein